VKENLDKLRIKLKKKYLKIELWQQSLFNAICFNITKFFSDICFLTSYSTVLITPFTVNFFSITFLPADFTVIAPMKSGTNIINLSLASSQ